ncbi:unnamed protein product [Sphagnum jensenii]|uniref:Transposase n=1 Tax=Sphagnum jensenii TaxID=128206 RepID=A0ABP0XDZ5_9BRYO
MLHHHFDLDKDTYEFSFSADIVEVIIGDLFFRDDEQLEDTDDDSEQNPADVARKQLIKKKNEKKNAMELFCKEEEVSVYTTTIKDVVHFDLAMDFVGIGLSFRTHRGQSFFDLRIRACYRSELVNLHLAAIPMFDRHSVVNIFNLIVKFMDALYNKWRAKLIGVSTDGENTMMGRHAGVVTRLVDCANHDVMRIWCAPHQIDIMVKATAEGINNGDWVKQAYSFFVYLRVQDNLIIAMNVKCPKKTNRWAHLGCLLNFYKSYRRLLLA